jgi:hypothetical protein
VAEWWAEHFIAKMIVRLVVHERMDLRDERETRIRGSVGLKPGRGESIGKRFQRFSRSKESNEPRIRAKIV